VPDQVGKLTDDEKTKAIAWLKEKWKEPSNCPISKDNNWTIGDHVITPFVIGNGGAISANVAYPHVLLICKTCGHTILFNAVMMGIFPPGVEPNART
jgi:hypothetical protein